MLLELSASVNTHVSLIRLIIKHESKPVLFTVLKSRILMQCLLFLFPDPSFDVSTASVAATQLMPILALTNTPLADDSGVSAWH